MTMTQATATTPQNALTIGLVNNMPDAAIRSSERQFSSLIKAAAAEQGIVLDLKLYYLPDVPRTETVRSVFMQSYISTDELWNGRVDGLVVTGAEPKNENLEDEPYWGSLTRLIDWAEERTHSTIWSCLAAHAAVLYMDGINRMPLNDKLSGIFECAKALDHDIVAGVPPRWPVPHSRHNGLLSRDLLSKDYLPLTMSPETGIDTFLKKRNSLFLFFQGHLEYDTQSLLAEYLRDVKRYVLGEQAHYPGLPVGYFNRETEAEFDALKSRAMADKSESALGALSALVAKANLENIWKAPAVHIYRNWLSYILQEKGRQA